MPNKKKKTRENVTNNQNTVKRKSEGDTKKSMQSNNASTSKAYAADETNRAKNRKSYDVGGVKRLHSPFNKLAQNRTCIMDVKKNEKNRYLSTYRSSGLSPKEKGYIICSCQTRTTRYQHLKNLAFQAIKEQKIFTILGGCNPVRKALVERGWVEKIPAHRMNMSKINNGICNTKPAIQSELERLLLSSLVSKCVPNFIWRTKEEISNFLDVSKDCTTIENKLMTDAPWTTKQGLCLSLKRNYWFYIEDVAEVTSPRSYNTYDNGEIEDFCSDYRITACTSLLKWVLSMVTNDRPVFVSTGKISINVLLFALNRCKEYLFRKQNKDIDSSIRNISTGQWNTFIKKYYRIIGKNEFFQSDKEHKLPLYLGYASFLLKEIYRYRPQLSCEGCHNIWIIKPAHNSRGRGIRMASNLQVITNLIDKTKAKYVIQKYIEDPLLIYETKFDIRQYYLITSTYPLVIWMYNDCYLKFSSQRYNLKNYHESIHLTNNAVQKKYANCTQRHSELPQYNMWDSDQYKRYLNNIGKNKVWDNIIYPGMKKSIIAIMLSCQDTLGICKNKFELYGCDFILDNMYKPWLIEINSRPDLNHTTPVTAKICPAVLADIVKVVIDRRDNRNAPTGKFECIYQQPMTTLKFGAPGDLCVRGYSLPNDYFYKGKIPITSLYDDDFGDITKTNNSQTLIKKIKEHYYDLNTIMMEPEYIVEKPVKDEANENPEPKTQSEYELSLTATAITSQLDELMNRITLDNSHITKSFLHQSNSVKSLVKIYSNVGQTTPNWDTSEVASLQEDSSSRKLFSFSKLDDGPTGKASTVGVHTNKSLCDDFTDTLIEDRNVNNLKVTDVLEISSNSLKPQDGILDMTSKIIIFFSKNDFKYINSANLHNKDNVTM